MLGTQPRGIRNNNPGNVEYSTRTLWDGLDKPPTDGRFCIFIAPQYGIRVISKLLVAYQDFHDCFSLTDFLTRWAPPVENNTHTYILGVAKDAGIPPDQIAKRKIDMHDVNVRAKIIYGIIHHENGEQPYPLDLIHSACLMT